MIILFFKIFVFFRLSESIGGLNWNNEPEHGSLASWARIIKFNRKRIITTAWNAIHFLSQNDTDENEVSIWSFNICKHIRLDTSICSYIIDSTIRNLVDSEYIFRIEYKQLQKCAKMLRKILDRALWTILITFDSAVYSLYNLILVNKSIESFYLNKTLSYSFVCCLFP